jgi:acetylornithine deacetylase/succinyl-diaminopimelate desuccinylase-like protein
VTAATVAACGETWDSSVMPVLCDYVRIPNVSSAYDSGWRENGHMMRAAAMLRDWCAAQPVSGMAIDLLTHETLSPLLVIEIDPHLTSRTDTVLLYGHLDKQPEMTGWRQGLGPWEPVIEDGKLYGRGGADDGYSVFASLTAVAVAASSACPLCHSHRGERGERQHRPAVLAGHRRQPPR